MLHGRAAAVMGILLLPSEQNMVICAWHCWDDPVIAAPDTLEGRGRGFWLCSFSASCLGRPPPRICGPPFQEL